MKILLFIYLLQISIFCLCTELSKKEYVSSKVDQSEQIVKDSLNSSITAKQAEFFKKRMTPEFQFNKFSRDASNLDFSKVRYVSKIIMSRGSNALKKSFLNLLYKYKEKSILCSFEIGKILLYMQAGVGKQKEGLMIIEKIAKKDFGGAIDILINYYSITKNQEKEFYYLEKAATIGKVYEKFVYYCIEKKLFDKARKYFTLYIQDLKDHIHDIENGEIEITDEDGKIEIEDHKKRDYYIQIIKLKIKKDESFFLDTIRKAEKENNFSGVHLKLYPPTEPRLGLPVFQLESDLNGAKISVLN